jgi:hypothetical protein
MTAIGREACRAGRCFLKLSEMLWTAWPLCDSCFPEASTLALGSGIITVTSFTTGPVLSHQN